MLHRVLEQHPPPQRRLGLIDMAHDPAQRLFVIGRRQFANPVNWRVARPGEMFGKKARRQPIKQRFEPPQVLCVEIALGPETDLNSVHGDGEVGAQFLERR